MTRETYNGWKNRQTWNVALWLNNTEYLYFEARDYMKNYKGSAPYKHFIQDMLMGSQTTGDGIKWLSTRLDYKALNEMMDEL
jgi:hypothetical protein